MPAFLEEFGLRQILLKRNLKTYNNFDLIVANTLAVGSFIKNMENFDVPILWWIHEGTYALKQLEHLIPRKISSNVKIYANCK